MSNFIVEAEKMFLEKFPGAKRNAKTRLQSSSGFELCIPCGFIANYSENKKIRFNRGDILGFKKLIENLK